VNQRIVVGFFEDQNLEDAKQEKPKLKFTRNSNHNPSLTVDDNSTKDASPNMSKLAQMKMISLSLAMNKGNIQMHKTQNMSS